MRTALREEHVQGFGKIFHDRASVLRRSEPTSFADFCMRRLSLVAALFVVAAVSVPPAKAQQQPATVPTELAMVLLDRGGSFTGNPTPQIVVGRAPSGIPGSLTSANGAVIVGGIEYPQAATLVLAFTLPPNQALKAYDEHLLAAGWKPPPPFPGQGSGFVPSGYPAAAGKMYCADSGAVHVTYVPAANGGSYLKVDNNRNTQHSYCAPRDPNMLRGPSFKFPTLVAPPGMSQQGGGGGTGGDNVETRARLLGALEAPAIVAHYAKQLDSAGWKMGTIATSGSLAVMPAAAKDSAGTLWVGALTAWRISPTEVEVNIKLAHPSQR